MSKESSTQDLDSILGERSNVAWVVDLYPLVTKATGGLFPDPQIGNVARQILDLTCGPGSWAIEVASYIPDATVIGVDRNFAHTHYATAMAHVQHVENVSFAAMDVRKSSLPWDENSFDFIHGGLLVDAMDQKSWPPLLRECYRILKPGGTLCLTELDVTLSTSNALQWLSRIFYQALSTQQRTFSVDASSLGIAHMLGHLFKTASFEAIHYRSFYLDGSYQAQSYHSLLQHMLWYFDAIKDYLVSQAAITEQDFADLYQQMQEDMTREDFVCLSYGLTVWGEKPRFSAP